MNYLQLKLFSQHHCCLPFQAIGSLAGASIGMQATCLQAIITVTHISVLLCTSLDCATLLVELNAYGLQIPLLLTSISQVCSPALPDHIVDCNAMHDA
jgi:hypothetical protein